MRRSLKVTDSGVRVGVGGPSHGGGASCEIDLQEPDQVLTVRTGEKSPVLRSHAGQLLCPLWIDPWL